MFYRESSPWRRWRRAGWGSPGGRACRPSSGASPSTGSPRSRPTGSRPKERATATYSQCESVIVIITLLVSNQSWCWLPMSVLQFLSTFCPMSRICPTHVLLLSTYRLNLVLVLFLTSFCPTKSQFCPHQPQFLSKILCPVSFLSFYCPHFYKGLRG